MAAREPREGRRALGLVGLAALARLLAGVEEEVRVVGELLQAGVAVLAGVEARLQQAQREGRQREHLAAPLDRLLLEALEGHDGVDQPPVERLARVVLAAQEPDLLGALLPHLRGQDRGAEAAVERADARSRLAEAGVVGGDGQVAADVQHVPAADRVAGDHGDDRLGQPADLHVQVGDVEAPDARAGLLLVALVATHVLVAARAERPVALAGQDDHADLRIFAGKLKRARQLDHRLRAERVAHLRAVDGDLRDPVAGGLVADVLEVVSLGPHAGAQPSLRAVLVEAWLKGAVRTRPEGAAVNAMTYSELDALAGASARGLDIAPRERVGIHMPPGEDFAIALHAIWLRGGVAVPMDVRDPSPPDAGARVVLTGLPGSSNLTAAPLLDTHDLGAPAAIIHTSGSTGRPKPVELTFGNFLWSALGSGVALGVDPGERWLCALPLHHVGGLSIVVRSAIYATTALVHERWDTERVTAALRDEDVTLVSLVPTTLARVLDDGLLEPAALRTVLLGGAPIPPALARRAREMGVAVTETYGLTEACSQVTTGGPPLFCTRVRIADDYEIVVSGPTVAAGG